MQTKRTSPLNSSSSSSYLPDECWESIFKFIINDEDNDNNYYCKNNTHYLNSNNSLVTNKFHYLNSLSLVSKQFLSITNRLLFSLTVNKELTYFHIFKRFTNLTSLNIEGYHYTLDELLCKISCFPLKQLTSLNISDQPTFPADGLRAFSQKITTLTSLTFSNTLFLNSLNTSPLFLIAECFPLLEELHLSPLKLQKLRYLEEVILSCCNEITSVGLASALRAKLTLRSLSFSNMKDREIFRTSQFIDSLVSLKGLTCLVLHDSNISDELLYSIAREGLPLTRLVLQHSIGHSYDGIHYLLTKCQHIQHLDLGYNDFLKDQHVVELSSFLVDLVSINLSCCHKLTKSSLFTLARHCPSLSEIKMENISGKIVKNSDSLLEFGVYPQIKSLYLGNNSRLSDKIITEFASIFPNLQLLDLNNCKHITEGICQVLRKCGKIKHLNLAYCSKVKLLGMNFVVPNLEVLNLSHTTVDDETLYLISKNCCGLLQLSLKSAKGVTKRALKHVVENSTQLMVHGYVLEA